MAELTRSQAYELRIGRWSRRVAPEFLDWLAPAGDLEWLDVGCGTGALSDAVLESCTPRSLVGIEPIEEVISHTRAAHSDPRADFRCINAQDMPFGEDAFDIAVSGLVLNFIEDQPRALAEMKRVVRPGGPIAGYVWDFADEMELFRAFWDSARALDPEAIKHDHGARFPDCRPGPLAGLFEAAGLESVETSSIVVSMLYEDFDSFWPPLTYGTGGMPDYVKALSPDGRAALEAKVRSALPIGPDGGFTLSGRAWTVRGTVPGAAAT